MKILFYVEPHPVRDSYFEFSYAYSMFSEICNSILRSKDVHGVDVRIFINHILAEYKFKEMYSVWPITMTPNVQERIAIEDMASMWIPDGLNDWIKLMKDKDSSISIFYYEMLKRIKLTEFDYDVIVLWGENSSARRISSEFDVTLVHMELASMRQPFPRAVLMDPLGVNGNSSTKFMKTNTIVNSINGIDQSLVFSLLNDELNKNQQVSKLHRFRYYGLSNEIFDFINNKRKTVLVPLQLADDANILLYSKFNNLSEFLEEAVEPFIHSGWNVIIRPHPHAILRGGFVKYEQDKILKKYKNYNNVLVNHDLIELNYLSLIEFVDAVVTINSSVGFEAMILGTTVINLGKSVYNFSDFYFDIDSIIDGNINKDFSSKSNYLTTMLLGCVFPLQRRLDEQLLSRIKLWNTHKIEDYGKQEYIKEFFDSCSWWSWHNKDLLRDATIKDT